MCSSVTHSCTLSVYSRRGVDGWVKVRILGVGIPPIPFYILRAWLLLQEAQRWVVFVLLDFNLGNTRHLHRPAVLAYVRPVADSPGSNWGHWGQYLRTHMYAFPRFIQCARSYCQSLAPGVSTSKMVYANKVFTTSLIVRTQFLALPT